MKKILNKIFSLMTIATTSVSLPIVLTSCSQPIEKTKNNGELFNNNQQENLNGILFNDMYFKDIEEATNYYLINKKPLDTKTVIGDLNDSIIDKEFNRLNINKIYDYVPSKIKKAYKTASGKYVEDYNAAKKSYVNYGLIREGYDDFYGNIFSNREDAVKSIKNHTNKLNVPYYEFTDVNGKNVKVNPLNSKDIIEFKKYALTSIAKSNSALNDSNPFGLKYYIKNKKTGYFEDYLSSKNTSTNNLIDKDYIVKTNDLFNDISTISNTLKNEMQKMFIDYLKIENGVKINLSVSQNRYDDIYGGDRNIYKFKYNGAQHDSIDFEVPISDIYKILEKDITKDENLDFYKNTFYAFINRKVLEKSSNIHIKRGGDNYKLAEEATNLDIYGKKFNIEFAGTIDVGFTIGTDFCLLEHGSEDINNNGYYVGDALFNLNFKFTDQTKLINNFYNYLLDKLPNILFNLSSFSDSANFNSLAKLFENAVISESDYKSSLYKFVVKFINDDFNTNGSLNVNNKDYTYFDYNGYPYDNQPIYAKLRDQKKLLTELANRPKDILNNSISLKIINDFLYNSFGMSKENDSILNNDNIELVIEYNGYPIFSLNNDYVNMVKISNNVNNINDILNNILGLKNSEIDEVLINVSNKIDINKKYTNKILNNNYSPIFSIDNKESFNIDSFVKRYQKLFNNDFPLEERLKSDSSSLDPNPRVSTLGIVLAIYDYEKRLSEIDESKINTSSNGNGSELITSNNNLLILRNKDGSLVQVNVGQIINDPNAINVTLSDGNKNIVATTSVEVEKLLKQNAVLEPAKVIVIYDLDNNVVNSDFVIDGSYGDGNYDSEETIVDNALNTLIFSKNTDYVYYQKDDNTNELIKNSINQIYSLNLNNNLYYYPSFNDARNQLKSYIELNSTKINN